ncbi:MAG: exo-alpha-sialidase [Lewinellaceae bacterium]|nr:exo-alpha-sialidase [Lewinellaceae bacterium]
MQIHILAFLLFLHTGFSCRQVPENVQSLAAANISFQATDAGRPAPGTGSPLATDIVYKSMDGGQTWQDVSAGLPAEVQILTVFANDNEVLLGSLQGLYRSTKPPVAQAWAKDVFPVERITDISSGWAGPYVSSYDIGIFQLAPGRGIWKSMHDALQNKTILAVLETPDKALIVGCDNGIFKSSDGGKTWKQVFAEGMVSNLAQADGVLIGGGFRGVLRSTDGGEHWDWVLTEDGMALQTGRIGSRLFAITSGLGPWGKEHADPMGMATNRLRTSADGGKTWQRMDGELTELLLRQALSNTYRNNYQSNQPSVINDIKEADGHLFCSLEAGIFRSADGGETWKLILPSDGDKTYKMAVSGNVLFVVLVRGGC